MVSGSLSATNNIFNLPAYRVEPVEEIHTRRFRRNACQKTGFEDIPAVSEKRVMTERLLKWMGAQRPKRTFSSVAQDAGVTEGSVRNIFRDHVTDLQAEFHPERPSFTKIRQACVGSETRSQELLQDK